MLAQVSPPDQRQKKNKLAMAFDLLSSMGMNMMGGGKGGDGASSANTIKQPK